MVGHKLPKHTKKIYITAGSRSIAKKINKKKHQDNTVKCFVPTGQKFSINLYSNAV